MTSNIEYESFNPLDVLANATMEYVNFENESEEDDEFEMQWIEQSINSEEDEFLRIMMEWKAEEDST